MSRHTPKDKAAKKPPFERKLQPNGQPNPKYVDVLDEDKPIAGQHFVCMSFLSPEKILKQKEMYFFEEFVKSWDYNKSMEKFVQFLNFTSYKYNVSFEDLSKDFKEFVEEEKVQLKKSRFEDDYKTFMDRNEERLQKLFDAKHNFQTNARGIKVRGSYPTEGEAELRCKMLREINPTHDIYVGSVGVWMPLDPEAYKTGRVEYMEEELNQLMHEKEKNEAKAKQNFDQRVKESKQTAISENIKSAEKTGAKLTQSIDEHGNLIGVKNTQETALGAQQGPISTADICAELFEGENVVVGKTDNGQSRLLTGPFAPKKKDADPAFEAAVATMEAMD